MGETMEFSFNFGADSNEVDPNDCSTGSSSPPLRNPKRRRIEVLEDEDLSKEACRDTLSNTSPSTHTTAEIVHAQFNGGLVLKGVSARLVENEIAALESMKDDSLDLAKSHTKHVTGTSSNQRQGHDMPNKECSKGSDVLTASSLSSDLIPQVYEGGLKIWEGSGDLVNALIEHQIDFSGLKVIELGCGAAFPGIYAMQKGAKGIDFQDYNIEVLKHVTMPNVQLNIVGSPLAEATTTNAAPSISALDDSTDRTVSDRKSRESGGHAVPGGVETTPHQQALRYLAGDWACLQDFLDGAAYDVVLTAETLYSPESVPILYDTIKGCLQRPGGVAYVASKTYYFGVGGGTRQFREIVERDKVFDINVYEKLLLQKICARGCAILFSS